MNMKQLIFVGAVIGFFSAGAGFFIGQKMHENLFVRVVANEPILLECFEQVLGKYKVYDDILEGITK